MVGQETITTTAKTTTTVKVSSIAITPSALELTVGDTSYVSASVQPYNATNNSVAWSSDNTSVATVNEYGRVTAVSAGYTYINAKAEDGSGRSSYISVKVHDKTTSTQSIVTSIRATGPTKVKVGESVTYKVSAYDSNGSIVERDRRGSITATFLEWGFLTWDKEKEGLVAVGNAPGIVTIFFELDDDSSITTKITVTVVE